MKRGRRRGLFLDLDGTVADSLPVLRAAFEDFLVSVGLGATDVSFARVNGPTLAVAVADIRTSYQLDPPVEELLDQYWRILGDRHMQANPIEGAEEVLAQARYAKLATAIVTSGKRQMAKAWLARHELLVLVDAIVGGDDVQHGKPDPEPYRLAIDRTRSAAHASLAVEDSELGALSALRAGLPTVTIGDCQSERIAASPLYRGAVSGLRDVIDHLPV